MNGKKVCLVLLVVGVLVGLLFIIFNLIKGNNGDDELISDIRESYSEIKSDIKSYNGVRDELIDIINNYYSSNLENDYNRFIYCLDREDELLESIFDEVQELDELCLDRLFNDKDVNSICSDYKIYYETVYNVYLNDINRVNGFINSYNSQYSKGLEVYNSSLVKDYIDYDSNGIYLEREDSNGEN